MSTNAEDVQDVLGRIVRLHRHGLTRLARRIIGCDMCAADAVQEAIVCFWQSGLSEPAPEAWLRRAVVHRSLHARRSLVRRRLHEARAAVAAFPTSSGTRPNVSFETEQSRRTLMAAIEELPAPFRRVVEMREIEGLGYTAISRTLALPVGTVRSRLSRARGLLRRFLESAGTFRPRAALEEVEQGPLRVDTAPDAWTGRSAS